MTEKKKVEALMHYLSYLKYLKAIDVEHTHDFVASFGLCLHRNKWSNFRKHLELAGNTTHAYIMSDFKN